MSPRRYCTACRSLPRAKRRRLSHTLEGLSGLQRVAVMMGTPHNRAALQQAGLPTTEGETGGANDLLVYVQTETPTAAAEELREATERVTRWLHGAASVWQIHCRSSQTPSLRGLSSAAGTTAVFLPQPGDGRAAAGESRSSPAGQLLGDTLPRALWHHSVCISSPHAYINSCTKARRCSGVRPSLWCTRGPFLRAGSPSSYVGRLV